MSHIILEATGNIFSNDLVHTTLRALHNLVAEIAGADIHSCKSRFVQHQQYCIGNDIKDAHFLHLTIKLLSGRTREQLDTLGEQAFKFLKSKFGVLSHEIDMTVLVEEMPKQNYYKD